MLRGEPAGIGGMEERAEDCTNFIGKSDTGRSYLGLSGVYTAIEQSPLAAGSTQGQRQWGLAVGSTQGQWELASLLSSEELTLPGWDLALYCCPVLG